MSRIADFLALPPEVALPRIKGARQDLTNAILMLARKRDTYLLSEDSDDLISEIDRETDRLHLTLQRLAAAEEEMQRRSRPLALTPLSSGARIYA